MAPKKKKKMNRDDLLRMCDSMSEDQIIGQLERSLHQHKILKNSETREELLIWNSIFNAKFFIEKKGVDKISKDMNEYFKLRTV